MLVLARRASGINDVNGSMKAQILHCAEVAFTDEEAAIRPEGIDPQKGDEIDIKTTASDLGSLTVAPLLAQFEQIELDETCSSPISINREHLKRAMGVDDDELSHLLKEARERRLLTKLTIEKDLRAWLKYSRQKGCLLLMVSVEKGDSARPELPDLFSDEVLKIRGSLVGEGYSLERAVLMPNAHLTPVSLLETDSENAKRVIGLVSQALRARGMQVLTGSFGYGKQVRIHVMGHRLAYIFRSF